MILLSHPTGNQNVRHALKAFYDAGRLVEFVTTVATFDNNIFDKLSRVKLGASFARRRFEQELMSITKQQPCWEIGRMLALQLGLARLTKHEDGLVCIDSIYRRLDQFAAERVNESMSYSRLSIVYGYEDGALKTFEAAKKHGLKCVYDLPIAYWKTARRLTEEEAIRRPEWVPTMSGMNDSTEKFAHKDRELELADVIICPSDFVRDSLPKSVRTSKPIFVIPFGSPEVIISNAQPTTTGKQILKVLFVGAMTQRKGLADVFEAMKMLDPSHFELHVLGSPVAHLDFYKQQYSKFIHHKTRSHPDVLELMQSCDVLLLPSIVEGRALVQQEALACGLPIVVTSNAGGADLVEDGTAGFLVPIRDPGAIAEILKFLFKNRNQLIRMKEAAQIKARQVTWSAYRRRLVEVIG